VNATWRSASARRDGCGRPPGFRRRHRAETDITALIQRTLETVGGTDTTQVTAFTDRCPGLRAVLANADEAADFGIGFISPAPHEAGGGQSVDLQP
jgi:hypothetical protein